jgi:hypothetical protein
MCVVGRKAAEYVPEAFKRMGTNCNNGGIIVSKAKREGRQDRRKAAVPRMKSAPGGNRSHDLVLKRQTC